MQMTRSPALIALSIWLILAGLIALLNLSFPASGLLLALLAVAAGVLLLVGPVRRTRNMGWLLLAIWLIVSGLLSLLGIEFPASGTLLSLLAVAAGAMILLGR